MKPSYCSMSATVVSQHFGCTRKTIKHLRRWFRVTGNVADRPRSGRPRVTTAADDRYIVLQHQRNRRVTAAATRRQYGIHPQTVRNRLRQNVQPIRAYRLYFSQILTWCYRTARQDLCAVTCTSDALIGSLFSDECRFNLSHAEGRVKRFANACVSERDHVGGVSVLVWGVIMGGNKTCLLETLMLRLT